MAVQHKNTGKTGMGTGTADLQYPMAELLCPFGMSASNLLQDHELER